MTIENDSIEASIHPSVADMCKIRIEEEAAAEKPALIVQRLA